MNPQLVIYSKLAIGGLAGKNGSPYLDGTFGGEAVYPGGKLCPEFDLALAKAAGIDQVVLVRRDQSEDF